MRARALMVGQSLGRYTLEAKLGEGGMGVVFKARDTQLDRTVAIKILPAEKISDPDRKRRFVQEAKAASALNHPNIVTIHDIGSADGTDFIVMEYLAGATLDHAIPVNGLPLRQALKFATRIADALAKAHGAGIVHRDLKPSNVMVTQAGDVKVLDFGVAKLLEPTDDSAPTRTVALTDEGTTIGTPAYMSPEQAEGRKVDGRSDIFSFGSVLYEMVTGRKAFSGESRLSVLAKILNEEPVPPSRVSAQVSPDVEKAILRCLRKDPARRYQTMADLKVALEDLITESGASAHAETPLRSSASSWRRAHVALAALAAIGVAAYVLTRSSSPSQPDEPLRVVPLTSLPGVERSPSFSPDGNHVAFSWTGQDQNNADIYVQQIGAGSPLRLTTDVADDYGSSWAPDGRWIAFLRRQPNAGTHEVRLVPPLGGTERALATIHPRAESFRPVSLAWCPASDCVLVTDSPGQGKPDALFVVSLESGGKRQVTNPVLPSIGDSDPAVSPDGRWIVFRRDTSPFTGELYAQELGQGLTLTGEPRRLTATALDAYSPTWTADNREVLFSARGGLWRIDVAGGGQAARLPFVGEDGLTPVVSRPQPARPTRLVYVRSFRDANIWRVESSTAGAIASSPPAVAISSTRRDDQPDVSPDGRRVAFISDRSGEPEIWTSDTTGSNAVQLTTMNANPGFPRWSPDGSLIAFHSNPEGHGDVFVVPAAGGKPRNLTSRPSTDAFPSFSADGRWIYFGSNRTGETRIWKLPVDGGDAVPVSDTIGHAGFESPDGRDVYYIETTDRPGPVWRMPTAGGQPVKVLDGVVRTSFVVLKAGIFHIERLPGVARLQYYDFASRRSTTVAPNLGAAAGAMTASRDGRTVLYSRVDSSVDDLVLVENFR